MHRLKTALVLLVSLMLVCTGAFLPGMVAQIQDRGTVGQVQYGDAQSVELEIQENIPAIGKLALMYRMDGSIEVPDHNASMTCEEAEQAAFDVLQGYIDAGLIPPFESASVEVRCLLGTAADDPSLSALIWSITLYGGPDEPFFEVDLAIDDENGYLLGIDYAREQPLSEEEREKLLPAFAEFYFDSLGIADYGYFVTTDLEEQYVGDHARAVRYRFGDVVYGEVNVDLYIHEYGFYTDFPDL